MSAAKQNGCPGTYYNHLVSESFTKSNCGAGYIGSTVTFTVAANTYSSLISQADADAQAENYVLANGQAYANSNGTCIQLYYNTVQSQNFTSECEGEGYVGGTVTYTVPANTYSSVISQADANQMALDEILANGQAYANSPGNAVCNVDTNPHWVWEEGGPSYCLSVNGQLPPHLFVLATDINPNSATYNQTQWQDFGPNAACPSGNYYNAAQSGQFTRNNCGSGYVGSTVTYTVAPGTYSSTVSQAAANQLAINDVNANGQAYANANGTCTVACNSSNCTGNAYKCINNVCEQGVIVVTSCLYDALSGTYAIIYHYEWSDSSWSGDYEALNQDSCW